MTCETGRGGKAVGGVERLREYAGRLDHLGIWPGGAKLLEIADQIEREHAQTCEDHERQQRIIRDLQRERDGALRELRELRDSTAEGQLLAVESVRASAMDALEWAEEHGGLSAVRSVVEHGEELRRRVLGMAYPAGDGLVATSDALDEIDRRLMPPGYEWPRFEDNGEKVTNENCPDDAVGVFFALDSSRWAPMYGVPDNAVEMHERVKRPKQDPIGADGLPIKKGETVYNTYTKSEFVVISAFDDRYVNLQEVGYGNYLYPARADLLTHTKPEPPDSWERLEEDCEMCDVDYCDHYGLLDKTCNTAEGDGSTRHCTTCACTCGEKMARDLVRRAKALAEREGTGREDVR